MSGVGQEGKTWMFVLYSQSVNKPEASRIMCLNFIPLCCLESSCESRIPVAPDFRLICKAAVLQAFPCLIALHNPMSTYKHDTSPGKEKRQCSLQTQHANQIFHPRAEFLPRLVYDSVLSIHISDAYMQRSNGNGEKGLYLLLDLGRRNTGLAVTGNVEGELVGG